MNTREVTDINWPWKVCAEYRVFHPECQGILNFWKSVQNWNGQRQCSLDAEGPCVLWTLLRTLETHLLRSETRSFRFLPQSVALLPLQFCFWKSHVKSKLFQVDSYLLVHNLPMRIILQPFPIVIRKPFSSFCSSTTLLYIGPWTLQFQWYSQETL